MMIIVTTDKQPDDLTRVTSESGSTPNEVFFMFYIIILRSFWASVEPRVGVVEGV